MLLPVQPHNTAGVTLSIIICYIVCSFAVEILMDMRQQKLRNFPKQKQILRLFIAQEKPSLSSWKLLIVVFVVSASQGFTRIY